MNNQPSTLPLPTMDDQQPTFPLLTMANVMNPGKVVIITLVVSFVAQQLLASCFDYQITPARTILILSFLLCLLYGLQWLGRKVLGQIDDWLRARADQTLGQTLATKNQIAKLDGRFVTKETLTKEVQKAMSKHIKQEDLDNMNFVKFTTLNDKHSNIKRTLRQENEGLFVKKTEFSSQLQKYDKRIDDDLDGLKAKITAFAKQADTFITNEDHATKLTEQYNGIYADSTENLRRPP